MTQLDPDPPISIPPPSISTSWSSINPMTWNDKDDNEKDVNRVELLPPVDRRVQGVKHSPQDQLEDDLAPVYHDQEDLEDVLNHHQKV